jgi:hypothetical protein
MAQTCLLSVVFRGEDFLSATCQLVPQTIGTLFASLRNLLIHNSMLFKVGEPEWKLGKRVWRNLW